MFTQLASPLPVHVIGRGSGMAFAVIDYGIEHNLIWVTALDANGEIWCAPNPKVRLAENWTAGRTLYSEAVAANSGAAAEDSGTVAGPDIPAARGDLR